MSKAAIYRKRMTGKLQAGHQRGFLFYKKRAMGVWLLFVCFLLGGCGSVEEETQELVVVDRQKEKTQYNLTIASYTDVVLTQEISCTYEQLRDENLSFTVSGKTVSKVYVSQGDQVKKGQLLAELGDGGAAERIETLEYQIARNQALMKQTEDSENYEISRIWLQYIFNSKHTEEQEEAVHKSVEQVQQRYRYEREDYQDAIDLDTMELEKLRAELALNGLYAGINGTVTWMKTGLEGSVSAEQENVIRLVDSTECLFTVNDTKYADLFEEGVPVQLTVTSRGISNTYELLPYKMKNWKEKLFFSPADKEQDAEFELGISGKIVVELDRRENVLAVPKWALHTADDRTFVYCLGENDIREIRWVEVGLRGDSMVEIVSGIEEGDMIIL